MYKIEYIFIYFSHVGMILPKAEKLLFSQHTLFFFLLNFALGAISSQEYCFPWFKYDITGEWSVEQAGRGPVL